MQKVPAFFQRFLALLLLAGSGPGNLLAAVDLHDYPSIHAYTYSEPTEAARWAHAQIVTLDAKKDPLLWMHAYWMISIAADYTFNRNLLNIYDPEEARLPEAVAIAKSLGLVPEYLQLRTQQIIHDQGRSEAAIAGIEVLLNEPQVKNANGYEAFIHAEVAWIYYSMDRYDESFKALERAFRLSNSNTSVLSADRTRVLSDLGLLLAATGQLQRGLSVLQEAAQRCEQEVFYYLCGVVTYNLGEQQMRLNAVVEGKATYEMAIRLAERGGDPATVGTAYIGLADASLKEHKADEAILYANKAVQYLGQSSDDDWKIRAYLTRVDAYLEAHRLDEAAADMKEVLRQRPKEDDPLRLTINVRNAKLLAANQQWETSARLWSQVFQETVKNHSDRDRKNVAMANAALGLVAEEQKNIQLREELQARQKQIWLILGILLVACVALASAAFSLRKSREVKRSREKLQRILDNVDEGLLTIDTQLQIESEFSPAFRRLLPEGFDLKGSNFLEGVLRLARLSEEEHSVVRATLSSILGEEEISWEMNHGNLPREVQWQGPQGDRTVTLDWSPIYGATIKVQAILLSLRDVTERRRLEARVLEQEISAQKILTKILELQSSPPLLVQPFLGQARAFAMSAQAGGRDLSTWKRHLHTLKGEARGLGLRSLSQTLHALESQLSASPSDVNWDALRQDLEAYENLLQGTSTHPTQGAAAENLLDLVSRRLPDVQRILRDNGLVTGQVLVNDMFQAWTPEITRRLNAVLLHGLLNAIDHGFVRAKLERPVDLNIEAKVVGRNLTLQIRDNGQGLNWDKIRRLAASRQFTPGEGQTLADCLFLDGVSTAATLTETSGRGIGLGAIAALCHEVGGDVSLRDNDRGPGALLHVRLPLPDSLQKVS